MKRRLLLTGVCIAAVCTLADVPAANAQAPKAQKGLGSNVLINSSAQKTSSSNPADMYQLSIQRTELIKSIVDSYAETEENIESAAVTRNIMDDVAKQMPLLPAKPIENTPAKELNDKARAMMEEEFGSDTAKYEEILANDAAKEFPMYKLRDTVTVEYNKGPKQYRVSGKVIRITDYYVIVNDTAIDMVDLSDEERSKFDPQWNKYLREKYTEQHRAEFARQRNERIQENILKLKGEIFKHNESAGYIYEPLSDMWTNARECAKKYITVCAKSIKAAKEAEAKKAAAEAARKAAKEAVEGSGEDGEVVDSGNTTEEGDVKSAKTSKTSSSKSTAKKTIVIEDTDENQALYEEVMNKAEEQIKAISEDASGIDACPAYKNAMWGFSMSEVHLVLWKEPEFKYLTQGVGRDTIAFPADSKEKESGLLIKSVDLVYSGNQLNKVVCFMKNASRKEFKDFKGALTEQYGRVREDKSGDYLADIFAGKQESRILASADAKKEVQDQLTEAKRQLQEIQGSLEEAADDEKEDLMAKETEAKEKVQDLTKELQGFASTSMSAQEKYLSSRMDFKTDSTGATVLPFMLTWKGKTSSGCIAFYYDEASDEVTDIVFMKEVTK